MDEQLIPLVDNFGGEFWNEEEALGVKITRRREPKLDRNDQALNIVEVFQAIGGVPRMAAWANDHYDRFITKLYPKVLPIGEQQVKHSGAITIYHTSIPPSALDGACIDVTPSDIQEEPNGQETAVPELLQAAPDDSHVESMARGVELYTSAEPAAVEPSAGDSRVPKIIGEAT